MFPAGLREVQSWIHLIIYALRTILNVHVTLEWHNAVFLHLYLPHEIYIKQEQQEKLSAKRHSGQYPTSDSLYSFDIAVHK